MTTDSTSEEDNVPPPLPAKTRESCDYSNLPNTEHSPINQSMYPRKINRCLSSGKYTNKPLPEIPNSVINNNSYDFVEQFKAVSLDEKRRPPTPPPKPSRNSKHIPDVSV